MVPRWPNAIIVSEHCRKKATPTARLLTCAGTLIGKCYVEVVSLWIQIWHKLSGSSQPEKTSGTEILMHDHILIADRGDRVCDTRPTASGRKQ